MPKELPIKDFHLGWIPNDDKIAGRKSGLLDMSGMVLDQNGALVLSQGASDIGSAYGSDAHTLFSKYLNGSKRRYVAETDGTVNRDGIDLSIAGSATRAAFGVAYDYVLIASGGVRKKDDGSTLTNLGLVAPTTAPTVAITSPAEIAIPDNDDFSNWAATAGTINSQTTTLDLDLTAGGIGAVNNADAGDFPPLDLTDFGGPIFSGDDIFSITVTADVVANYEYIYIFIFTTNGSYSIKFYSLADLPTSPQAWEKEGILVIGEASVLTAKRSEFLIQGTDPDWAEVTKISISIKAVGDANANYIIDDIKFLGDGLLGTYEYAQMNVFSNGAYVAQSPLGPLSEPIVVDGQRVQVTPQDPSAIEPQANEVWYFRRGGLLDRWYRVYRATSSLSSAITDSLSDVDALALNIHAEETFESVQNISENILAIVGPINRRWIYVTEGAIYISEINSPDTYDTRYVLGFVTTESEAFLWAIKAGQNLVAIGTTSDIYLLSGSFIELPDGYLDVSLRTLSIDKPPICRDVAFINAQLIYMSSDGLRLTSLSGESTNLISPNLDRLYKEIETAGFKGVNFQVFPELRYPVAVIRNELWVTLPLTDGNKRTEVYDFVRQYWRNADFTPDLLYAEEDGNGLGFWFSDNTLRLINDPTLKTYDGADRSVSIKTLCLDNNDPSTRKEVLAIKFRINTGGDDLTVVGWTDNGKTTNALGTVNTTTLDDHFLSLDGLDIKSKNLQLVLTGTFSELLFSGADIIYEDLGAQSNFFRIPTTNLGSPNKKRIRAWPFLIESPDGTPVTFTPIVDNVELTATAFDTSSGRQTQFHHFLTDVFGIDYGGKLTSADPFEIITLHPPEVVQTLPVAKRFDQLGPEQFFQYGKIRKFIIRIIAFDGTEIPWNLFQEDVAIADGTFEVPDGRESEKVIVVPKGVDGSITRLELGPTTFDFHRLNVVLQVMKSGQDTDNEWVYLD